MRATLFLLLLILATALPQALPQALPWPPTLSLSRSELQRGQPYTATASVPGAHAVALRLPAGITASPAELGGDGATIAWRLTVADDAPLSRVPVQIGLLVDGQLVSEASVRIWTEEPVELQRIFLPMLEK